ncbi:MAG: hypothetical protein ACYTG0_25575 [Planctomycetota bacterium]|jgi:hypothetical protein
MSIVSPPSGTGKPRFRFCRQAESAATRILEAFQAGNLPKALAPVFVRRKDNVPSGVELGQSTTGRIGRPRG